MMNLKEHTSRDGKIETTATGWRLVISKGANTEYRLAQLDDTLHLPRRKFPEQPPLTLSLRARTSSETIPGTWGFGLWNDPFGLSLGFGGAPFNLPALPNAIWYFHASPQNYLSFREDKPAQGFLAQAFRSPRFHPLLFPAGLMFPFSRRRARRLLSRVVQEDAAITNTEVTQWHTYRLEWMGGSAPVGMLTWKNTNALRASRSTHRDAMTRPYSRLWVDETLVQDTPVSPRPPLGLVIWVDNQYAAFTPQGQIKWGLEENPTEAWLEIANLELTI
jgi:hypothetical protein